MAYDALVIGGRVAGSAVALLLARQGRRVLVVDRDSFPSDTLSTHYLNFTAVGLLARLGVLADVETAGFRRLYRNRTWFEDCCIEGPGGPGGTYGLAPRRDVLDSVLMVHAQRAGVEILQRTVAERLIEEGGRVAGAVLRTAEGEREIRASVVVGADGRHSRVAEWVGAEKYLAVPAIRPVYYAYYRGITPLPQPSVEMSFGGDQIGFVFPMRPQEDCVAVEISADDFESFRRDPQASFEARVRELPGLTERLRDAAPEGKVQGVKGIENYFRRAYGPGWLLVGDAGYLRDPSTGMGIGDALMQAFWAADALGKWLDGADWDASLGGFARKRDEVMMPAYRTTIEHTRARDPSPGEAALIRTMLFSPLFARPLLHAVPRLLSELLSPDLLERANKVAQMFAAEGAATPAVAGTTAVATPAGVEAQR